MVKFEIVEVTVDLIECLSESFKDNQDEVSPVLDKLKVDIFHYLSSENLVVLAKDGEEIVGYSCYFINKHHHYDSLFATQDVIYLSPSYRKGFTGMKMLKFIESSLKDLGVKHIILSSTTNRDLSKLFGRLGYEPVDVLYKKEI